MLWNVLFFIIAIVILVSFHEWGHYLFARLFKVKIITFSVGFGQKLLSWTNKKDTDFVISAIPLGGYVRMAGSKEKDENNLPFELKENEVYYDQLPPIKRIIISLAGPFFNFILAYLIYAYVFIFPVTQQNLVFDEVIENSIVANSGMSGQFELISLNGREFNNLRELRLYLYRFVGSDESVQVEYLQDSNFRQTTWELNNLQANHRFGMFGQLGLIQKEQGYQVQTIEVMDGSAKMAGMQKGDVWYSINGVLIDSALSWVQQIQQGGKQDWQVLRDGQLIELTIVPIKQDPNNPFSHSIGVRVQSNSETQNHLFEQDLTIFGSMLNSVNYTWSMIEFNVISIFKLLKGELGLDNLGGPGTMADASGSAAKLGILSFLSLLAILSISLGVINLLPVPMLDGGNVLIDSIELIRRKALSESWQLRFRAIGLFFVLSVMAVAITNDIFRYF